jgi:hypothetical protein
MLNIIKPDDHFLYEEDIDSFLRLLKIYQSFSLDTEEKENATFIIGSDDKRGVYGGAVLYRQNVDELYNSIGKIVSNFQPGRQEVLVARIGFYIEHDESMFSIETLDLRESFYKNLLKIFMELGWKNHMDLLVLKLCPPEFYQTKRYGYWPYIIEISKSDSSDGLFHGILSLAPRTEGGIK